MCTIFALLTMMFFLGILASLEHISSLYQRLSLAFTDNNKLINGMNEGLLILSQPDNVLTSERALMFCNKSGIKVINNLTSEAAKIDPTNQSFLIA